MELINLQTVNSGKSNVFLGEYEGRNYIRKICKLSSGVGERLMWVSSPYVAKIFEFGENYMIMEYVEGTPLNEAKILPKEVYGIAIELCEGITALHKNNIIHRDIKPSNIILTNERHVKIIDFDAARIKKPDADKDTSFVGTDGFAPPEQYGFMQTDERSDIHALGITIKTLLQGLGIYEHSPYRAAVKKCIRFNPEQRYKSVKAVKSALTLCRFRTAFISFAAVLCAAFVIASAVDRLDLIKLAIPTQLQDVVIHEKSERNVPWDLLALPEGFPQLSDSVTCFWKSVDGPYTFWWDYALPSEAEFISNKLSEWFGVPPEKYLDTAEFDESQNYSFKNDDYEALLVYCEVWGGVKQMQLYITAPDSDPVFAPEKRDWIVPENNPRPVLWSELELPEYFTELSESVASFETNGAMSVINWGEASRWEAVGIAEKFYESCRGELICQICQTNNLSWGFEGDSWYADLSFSTNAGEDCDEIELCMSFH